MNIPTGLNRDKALDFVRTEDNWTKKDVIVLLSTMSAKTTGYFGVQPKIGDVFTSALMHPSLIFRISNGLVYSFTLTTESTYAGILIPCSSRFYSHSFISSCISVTPIDKVMEMGINVYDKMSDVIKAKRLLNNFYKSLKLPQ